MNNIELRKLISENDRYVARRWTYQPFGLRQAFKLKLADRDGTNRKCPVDRFEIVKLSTTGRDDWFGVVTSIKIDRYRSWRTDYTINVKMFDTILDAIDYSEKKRKKYGDN